LERHFPQVFIIQQHWEDIKISFNNNDDDDDDVVDNDDDGGGGGSGDGGGGGGDDDDNNNNNNNNNLYIQSVSWYSVLLKHWFQNFL